MIVGKPLQGDWDINQKGKGLAEHCLKSGQLQIRLEGWRICSTPEFAGKEMWDTGNCDSATPLCH